MTQESRQSSGTLRSLLEERGTSVSTGADFVITLCQLQAPITIPQPRSPHLSRYSFFMTHCWQGGQREYRLHMGHFRSPEEAEKWLLMLKRVYPGAHIAEAPAAQPDLMNTTQRLRIIDIGSLGGAGEEAAQAGATIGAIRPQTPATADSALGGAQRYVKSNTAGFKKDPSLEQTLDELRTSHFDMNVDDTDATGVRHLRFEVEKASRASATPAARTRPRR